MGEPDRQHRAGVDRRIRRLAVRRAELPDGVEVLESQSHRIDHAMALTAGRIVAVLLQTRAHRLRRLAGASARDRFPRRAAAESAAFR